ncbi:MAG: family 20 glycosylhydrolase [Magnetococcus sp. WYHC-3]
MTLKLFPLPRHVRVSADVIDFRTAQWICLPPEASDNLKQRVLAFAEEVGQAFHKPLQVTAATPSWGDCFLKINPLFQSQHIQPQGYRLRATPKGVSLDAADEAGVYYGLLTLAQIITQCGAKCQAFMIQDWPDFPRRGVMLDISRSKVPTMATFYQLLDRLARWKINEVQLYTEHTFAYAAHRAVWFDSSPMTAAEIMALDAFCRERYMELVPNQNSFGHFERWLQFPAYRHLAECPDGFERRWGGGRSPCGSTLAPRPASLAFLKGLYAELLPNFSSRFFNVGCDETWELGQGWSKPQADKRGKTRVYLDFLLKIRKLVVSHQRQMMFWGDIILHQPELIRELKPDMIAMEWGYEATHPFDRHCPLFAASGIPFYVCPGTSSWNSITGRTRNAVANLANAASHGMAHGAKGFLNTDWGDGGHHQYLPISYVGFAAGAAYAWCWKRNVNADLPAALNRDLFADQTGVLGRLFYELGEVRELIKGRTDNCSVFHTLMFWNMDPASLKVQPVTPAMLAKVLARFEQLEAAAADARPAAADGGLARAELCNAIAMARHATRRALGVMTRRIDRAALAAELRVIIGRHAELWLARNRPGGLHESSERLRDALRPLAACRT